VLRICWNIIPLFFACVALTFTLLVMISGTSAHNQLSDIYFMKINTTDIIPVSVPASGDFNSTAESLGLHDFYQNSLWGYCEGDNDNDTVSRCSNPTPMYTFDITQIFSQELFAGQTVDIPQSISDNLGSLHTASHWMFAFYMVGVILAFITVLVGLTALCTRFGSVITTIVSGLAFLFIIAATLVAQVIFAIYRNAINGTIAELNVSASLGTAMFAFSWTASLAALVAFVGFTCGICCGTGRRGYYGDKA